MLELRSLIASLALMVPCQGSTVELQEGDIVVADPGSVAIFRVDAESGGRTTVAAGGGPDGLLVRPLFLVAAPNGDLLVSDAGKLEADGTIVRIDRETGTQSVVSADQEFVNPFGIAVAPDGYLYVTDRGMQFQNAEGQVVDETGDERIIRVDPATGAQAPLELSMSVGKLEGITVAPDGTLFVADSGLTERIEKDERILRVDPVTGKTSVVTMNQLLATPRGLLMANGLLYVADQDAFPGVATSGGIITVEPQTGGQGIAASSSMFRNPQDVAMTDDALLLTDIGATEDTEDQRLFLIKQPTNGPASVSILASEFVLPWGVTTVGAITCGDGVLDAREQCDEGEDNGRLCCRTTCVQQPVNSECNVEVSCVAGAAMCTSDGQCAPPPGCPGVAIPPVADPVTNELPIVLDIVDDGTFVGKAKVVFSKSSGRLAEVAGVGAEAGTAGGTSASIKAGKCQPGARVVKRKPRLVDGSLKGPQARLVARLTRRGKKCLEQFGPLLVDLNLPVKQKRRGGRKETTATFRGQRLWR